jgi:hypothetical protein
VNLENIKWYHFVLIIVTRTYWSKNGGADKSTRLVNRSSTPTTTQSMTVKLPFLPTVPAWQKAILSSLAFYSTVLPWLQRLFQALSKPGIYVEATTTIPRYMLSNSGRRNSFPLQNTQFANQHLRCSHQSSPCAPRFPRTEYPPACARSRFLAPVNRFVDESAIN